MSTSREQIYAALFAKLVKAATFKTTDRRWRHWSDVAPPDQPALFQSQRHEDLTTQPPDLNPRKRMFVDVSVYVNTGGDKTVAPASILNPLIDAIEAALGPDVITNKQTLGGLVQYARIEGRIETDEGLLGDQGVAIIPILIEFV